MIGLWSASARGITKRSVTVLTPGPDSCGVLSNRSSIPIGPRSSAPGASGPVDIGGEQPEPAKSGVPRTATPWSTLDRHRPEPPRAASDNLGPAGSRCLMRGRARQRGCCGSSSPPVAGEIRVPAQLGNDVRCGGAGSVAHGNIVVEPVKAAPGPDAVGKHGPQPGNLGGHSHVRCDVADAPSGTQ